MGASRRRTPSFQPTSGGRPGAKRVAGARFDETALLDRIDDLVWVNDLEGNVRWANYAAVRALGWSLDELTRKNLAEILAPEGRVELAAYLDAVSSAGHAEGTLRVVTRNGERRHWEFRNSLHESAGAAPLVYGVARDITERELDEERRREIGARLRLALEASNVGLWDWDLTTDRAHFSREWKRQIGYEDHEISDEFSEWRSRCHPDDLERVLAGVRRYLDDSAGPFESEFRFRHRDGRWLWILARAEVLRDVAGGAARMLGCHVDVTERVAAEKALQLSEARYRALFDCAPDGIFVVDEAGRFVDASPSASVSTGYTRDELLRLQIADLTLESELPRLGPALAETAAGGTTIQEWRFHRKDGTTRVGEIQSALMPDGRLLGILRDVTERKRAEEALRESEERFAAYMQTMPLISFMKDVDGRLIYANEAFEKSFGIRLADCRGKTDAELWPPETARQLRANDIEILASGQPVAIEETVERPDGLQTWVSYKFPFRDAKGRSYLAGTAINITERQRVEAALRESEARQRLLVEASNIGLWDWNLLTDEVYLSPEWKRQLGYLDDELPNRFEEWRSRLHPDDLASTLAAVADFREHRRADYEIEFRLRHLNGSWRWILSRADMVHDAGGRPVRMMGCHVDITERKRSEELLRVNQAQLRALVEQAPISIAMFDREMRYLVASRRWAAEYGRGFLDLEGRSHYEVHPDLPERWKEVHRRGLAGETLRNDDDLWIQADGTQNWLRWAVLPWRDAQGEIGGIILSAEDISERRRAEEAVRALPRRLLAAQEDERRRIARELHDELGQILTAVKLNLQALDRQESPVAAASLEPALASLERALAATHDLSLELRPSILDDLGLIPALRWQLDRFGRDAGLAVHFATDVVDERFGSELETVCFRVAQEALTNVARHAAAREVWLDLGREDGWLALSVRDDGCGFDLAAATARAAAGESLGLLGMRERISLAGGELEIRSRPGAGTEVRARVPAFLDDPADRRIQGGAA